MCFSYQERLAWIRRMEQMEKDLKIAEERKQQAKAAPAKPKAPATGAVQEEPVPV
jgi:hypothetical protein